MKKLRLAVGFVIVGVPLLSGCIDDSARDAQIKRDFVDEIRDEFTPQTGPFSKYQSVKEYITDIGGRWAKEANSGEEDKFTKAAMEIANDALGYADWFEAEIAYMGLKEDFDNMISIGREMMDIRENEPLGEYWEFFYNSIGEILVQIDGTDVIKRFTPEDEERLAVLKQQTVEHAEYLSLEEFVYGVANDLQEGSEYRAYNATPEYTLAFATVHYINYFEDEIKAKRRISDFARLQILADDVVQGVDGEDFEVRVYYFEKKLNEIIVNMYEAEEYEDIQSWASASVELLSQPIDTNDKRRKDIALRAKQVAYSFPQEEKKLVLVSEEVDIDAEIFLLASEVLFLQNVAVSAKDYEELQAKYDKFREYIEDVAKDYL